MSDSTLSVTLDEIRSEVCRYLGFGRSYTAATAVQQEDCDLIVRRGLRQFYTPIPIPGETKSHRWTFLEPSANINLSAGVSEYELPPDFGGMIGDMNFVGELWPKPVRIVSSSMLRESQASSDTTRRPTIAAVEPSVPDGPSVNTHWRIIFHHTPDSAYSLVYRYYVSMDALKNAQDMVPGGALHGEAILASCLAIAETYAESPNPKYRDYFKERLIASILMDRQTSGAGVIGRNSDRSDMRPDLPQKVLTTYNGILY